MLQQHQHRNARLAHSNIHDNVLTLATVSWKGQNKPLCVCVSVCCEVFVAARSSFNGLQTANPHV